MLSSEQRAEFDTWGVLRLPAAILPADAERMLDLVWAALAEEHGIYRDVPETWTVERPAPSKKIERTEPFRNAGLSRIREASDDLLGPGCWESVHPWRPLVTFARAGVPWDVPKAGWHYDRPFRLSELQTLPGYNLFGLLAPTPHTGGGTILLAGSHHLIRTHTERLGGLPVHSKVMKAILGDSHEWLSGLWSGEDGTGNRVRRYLDGDVVVDGVPLRLVEVTGEPGDVYLMHAAMLHNAPPNVMPAPRMMAVQRIYRPELLDPAAGRT